MDVFILDPFHRMESNLNEDENYSSSIMLHWTDLTPSIQDIQTGLAVSATENYEIMGYCVSYFAFEFFEKNQLKHQTCLSSMQKVVLLCHSLNGFGFVCCRLSLEELIFPEIGGQFRPFLLETF